MIIEAFSLFKSTEASFDESIIYILNLRKIKKKINLNTIKLLI